MAIEVEVFDLDSEIKQYLYKVHGFSKVFNKTTNDKDRVLHGWYERKGIKIKFYYKPSWVARQRMYWFHGWKWVSVDEQAKAI